MVNFFLAGIGGFLLSCSFAPIDKWWLAPIGLFLHIFALSKSTHKVLHSFVFALVFNSLLLHWTSTYVGSLPWLILAVGLSIFYLPLSLVSRWGMASYPIIFVILEEIRNRFPFGGFGWARVAYSQADSPYADMARLGGATSLSALVTLIALFFFYLSTNKLQPVLLLPLLLLFIPNNVTEFSQTKVLLIQGNVPKLGLDFNERATQVFINHRKESEKALLINSNVDFMLWPENAVDVDPFTNIKVRQALDKFEVPLIVGAIVKRENKILNTSILWTNEGANVYAKQALTPFGEYIPLRPLASWISPLVDQVSDFSPGNKSSIFLVNEAKIAPVICFELIQDDIVTQAAKASNILAVQTNSATFGTSSESAQQLSITRIRAIEHSRNILSVSTTGYSAVIDFSGKILNKTSMAQAEHIFATVGLIDQQSIRDRLGNWALGITLIFLLVLARRRYT